jgi:transposase
VVIGMDPHKRSATIEILDQHEHVLARGRYSTDCDGYQQMLQAGQAFPERIWAVEGAAGVGRPLAQRLVADGETVLDVPAKLAARARVFDTGNGRKTDAADAHSVAVVALRAPGLARFTADDRLEVLRLLVDRHEEMAVARTQTVNRLHRLLAELVPGGAGRFLSSQQARALIDRVHPADQVGHLRRELVMDLIADIEHLDRRIKDSQKRLRQAVTVTGSRLPELYGIGPVGAARILADVGNIARFPSRGHFASWNGTAPLDASSGEQRRHRLSRAGNRRINRVLHIMAIVQIRHDTEGRAYYRRKLADGKTPMEALRCLKRRLSNLIYRQLTTDAADVLDAAETVARALDPISTPAPG